MNVLIITADDMAQRIQNNVDVFSRNYMPTINSLIANGTLFNQAYVQGAQCLEVRGSLMNSSYPSCTNVIGKGLDRQFRFNNPIGSGKPEAITMDEWFQTNGYNTYGYGKNHHTQEESEPGWDRYFDVRPGFPNEQNQWADTTGIPLPRNGYTTVHAQPGGPGLDFGTWPTLTESDIPDYLVTQQWIADLQNFEGPWFSMVGLNYPHLPIYLPEPWASLYDDETITLLPDNIDDKNDKPCVAELMYQDGFWVDYVADTTPDALAARTEMNRWTMKGLTYMDKLITDMLDALNASPFAQDTLIVFLSDHGRNFGEKRRWNKGDLWEQVANQFMLFHGPGIPAQKIELPVEVVNLMPTLSDLAGIPQRDRQVGRIMTPLIKDGEDSPDWCDNGVGGQVAFNQFKSFCPGIQHNFLSYRKGDLKVIWYGTDDYVELYNVVTDPYEETNLAASNPALATSMVEAMKRHHNCFYPPYLQSPMGDPGQAQAIKLVAESANDICQVITVDSLPSAGQLFQYDGVSVGNAIAVGDTVPLLPDELGCALVWYVPNVIGSTEEDSFVFSSSDMGRPWNSAKAIATLTADPAFCVEL